MKTLWRKKPIIVSAEQFTVEMDTWPEGVYETCGKYWIDTLEGKYTVTPGDWIITGVKGAKYPCKPDIFKLTYECVEESHDPT